LPRVAEQALLCAVPLRALVDALPLIADAHRLLDDSQITFTEWLGRLFADNTFAGINARTILAHQTGLLAVRADLSVVALSRGAYTGFVILNRFAAVTERQRWFETVDSVTRVDTCAADTEKSGQSAVLAGLVIRALTERAYTIGFVEDGDVLLACGDVRVDAHHLRAQIDALSVDA
jgi:hypothetical protein